VIFKEDQSRLRAGHGARNMAVVRHFAILFACGQDSGPTAGEYVVKVPANRKSPVNTFAFHAADCAVDPNVSLELKTDAKGRVELETLPVTIQTTSFPQCIGKTISGTAIFYTPAADFLGNERVTVRIKHNSDVNKGTATYVFVMRVE
jgi:hypothetical protein